VFYFLLSVNGEFWHRGCKCKKCATFERSGREKAPWIWRSKGPVVRNGSGYARPRSFFAAMTSGEVDSKASEKAFFSAVSFLSRLASRNLISLI